MSLLRIGILIILIVSLFKTPSLYSDGALVDAMQKMPLTGGVVENKETNSESDEEVVKKIDINNADIEELKTLYGVGAVIAKRIVQYRNVHGRFNAIEDIIKVKGIGEKKFKKLKDMITVKEPISKKNSNGEDK